MGAGEAFEGVFAPEGGAEGGERFGVFQGDRAAGAGVAGAAFGGVVVDEAAGEVGRVTDVEGGVGAAENIHEVAGTERAGGHG